MKKRMLSILLTLCMAASLLPVTAGAESSWYDTYRDFLMSKKYLDFLSSRQSAGMTSGK